MSTTIEAMQPLTPSGGLARQTQTQETPPAQTREEALQRAINHMRAPVYYQFFLFIIPATVMAVSGFLFMSGALPALAAIIINGIAQYFAFTVLHDSAHSVYCRESVLLQRLNAVCSRIVGIAYLIPFSAFKFAHLGHHHHFNDAERDPDYWVAGRNPLRVISHCATMHIPYYGVILRKAPMAIRLKLIASLLGIIGLVIASWAFGFLTELLVIWLIPAHIAIFLVAFVFDWMFHHPHHEKMFGDAPAYLLNKHIKPIASFCVANQTFHLIHHLYPRVPWTRVEKLYWEIEPWLRKEGIKIVDWR